MRRIRTRAFASKMLSSLISVSDALFYTCLMQNQLALTTNLIHALCFADKNTNTCQKGSWPIAFSDIRTTSHFDYTSSIENISISDSRGLFIDGCGAASKYGVDDIVITDLDGSFISSLGSTTSDNETFGVLVSNNARMMFGECFDYPSNCMAYCPGTCLRTVTFAVEQYGTENIKLEVTSE